jgi:thioredoxin 1
MKSLAYLILCLAPLAMAGGQTDAPVPGKVTLVYFWAEWCAPCKMVTPALQQMASTDTDIALRKIDLTEPGSEERYNINKLPQIKVYNRGGSLVGTVVGADVGKIKSYVAQAKSGG